MPLQQLWMFVSFLRVGSSSQLLWDLSGPHILVETVDWQRWGWAAGGERSQQAWSCPFVRKNQGRLRSPPHQCPRSSPWKYNKSPNMKMSLFAGGQKGHTWQLGPEVLGSIPSLAHDAHTHSTPLNHLPAPDNVFKAKEVQWNWVDVFFFKAYILSPVLVIYGETILKYWRDENQTGLAFLISSNEPRHTLSYF